MDEAATDSTTLKEALFTREHVEAFADRLREALPGFDRAEFVRRVLADPWPDLELKQRMRHITTVLHDFLPADFRAALDVLRRALEEPIPGVSFISIVPSDYVSVYGQDDPDASIPALEYFTQRMSAEFAVRPFLVKYPDRMLAQMLVWAQHPDEAVRRLASEGSRPRLPWGIALPALKQDPSPLLPILDTLRHDASETVRRSVANNLNDIAKDHPDVVVEVLERWQDGSDEIAEITPWALRTLVKAGHPGALALLGISHGAEIVVRDVRVEPATIPMGGEVTFSFEIESTSEIAQDLVIDYVVCYPKAKGKQSEKVWKLARRVLYSGEVATITRTHSFRPVTTRKYYPGEHSIAPKINGQVYDAVRFTVTE